MKRSTGMAAAGLVALGLLGGGLGGGWLAQPRAEAQAAPTVRKAATAVAVMDISQVYRSLKEREAVRADNTRRMEGLKEMQTRQAQEIRQLTQEWETMQRMTTGDAAAVRDLGRQIEEKTVNYRVQQEVESLRVQQGYSTAVNRMYRKMTDAAGRVAQDNGYDLVLFDEPVPDFRRIPPQQMDAALGSREVLWAAERLDITDQVVTRMNNEYAASAGGQP